MAVLSMLSSQLASFTAVALALSLTFVFYLLLRCAYYAFFHPLAKAPGPKLYAASSLPYYLHLLRGDWHQSLKEMHDRYGPVVRFAPTDISFITATALKQIYGHKSSLDATFVKDPPFYQRGLKDPTIINANHEDHKRFRRLLSHAFSEKALRSQEDILKLYIDKFINRLAQQAHDGVAVDLVSWYNFATFDLIGDLSFGEPFGCLDSGGYHPWVRLVFQHVKAIPYRQIAQYLNMGFLVPYLTPKRLVKGSKQHLQLSRETAMKRVASTTDRADFISYILRHNDEKGIETTATLLSGVTFQLLTNKSKLDKLVSEIRSSFDAEDDITLERVNQLSYLLAVLNEGLRIYPPVPTGLPRLVPPGGERMERFWIPEKASLCKQYCHTFANSQASDSAFHSESNFRDADSFVPERWLGDDYYSNDSKDVLQPFSTGPRNCIGKNLAYAEMRLILARLLWKFDLEILEDSKDWDSQKSFLLWEKGALLVRLTEVIRD
ncbi:cytochrome P450, partial [Fusarium solani]